MGRILAFTYLFSFLLVVSFLNRANSFLNFCLCYFFIPRCLILEHRIRVTAGLAATYPRWGRATPQPNDSCHKYQWPVALNDTLSVFGRKEGRVLKLLRLAELVRSCGVLWHVMATLFAGPRLPVTFVRASGQLRVTHGRGTARHVTHHVLTWVWMWVTLMQGPSRVQTALPLFHCQDNL